MNSLTKHYGQLTPAECFRLLLAAGARGDEIERDRLTHASERITLSMPAHAPYGSAFQELALATCLELLDAAAFYHNCNERVDDELRTSIESASDAENDIADDDKPGDDAVKYPAWHGALELACAAGFLFKAKLAGWKLFCERWNAPPAVLWEVTNCFSGVNWLKRTVDGAEAGAAFPTPADMVRWLNRIRPAGDPEATEAGLISAERFADSLDAAFRERVVWWGG